MKILLMNISMYLSIFLWGQHKDTFIKLQKSDYPSSKYKTSSDTSHFGKIDIITTMIHPKNDANDTLKYFCRSWLTIKKNGKILKQKYYDIEPVGGCSGVYTPTKQPCKELFILSKFGDYKGETLIIDSTGKLVTLTGGTFSVTADFHYLFTTYDSDVSGITIYDLKNKKSVFSKERSDEERYNEFYFQDGYYLVSFEKDATSKDISVGYIDIKNKKITISKKPTTFLKKNNRLESYNAVQSLAKCNCGE